MLLVDEVPRSVMDRRAFIILTGVLMAPLASLGQQQSKVARIGFLAGDSLADNRHRLQSFREGLHELG
jgi:hypothetical protein